MYKLLSLLLLTTFISAPNAIKAEKKSKESRTSSGLVIETLKKGSGKPAKTGDLVEVHYSGWLKNGIKFDSSHNRRKPFGFKLGEGRVIKGWDEGVVGMQVGEKRKLTIPPELAYGGRRIGPIPPNSTLIFEIELLKIAQ